MPGSLCSDPPKTDARSSPSSTAARRPLQAARHPCPAAMAAVDLPVASRLGQPRLRARPVLELLAPASFVLSMPSGTVTTSPARAPLRLLSLPPPCALHRTDARAAASSRHRADHALL